MPSATLPARILTTVKLEQQYGHKRDDGPVLSLVGEQRGLTEGP